MNVPNSNSVTHEAVLETPSTNTAALPISHAVNPTAQNRLRMNMDTAGAAETATSANFGARSSAGDSFLSMDLGEDAAARIRDSLTTATHTDPLELSADHIHAFVEVNRLSSQPPTTSESAQSSASVIQSSTSQGIGLSAYSELDYGGLNMPPAVEPTPDLPTSSSSIQRKRRAPPQSHNEPASDPSSADEDEQFDTTELLSSSILHDEMASRLASSGPIGLAAAAAIVSSRKKSRPYTFESNPALRKRHRTKLLKRLKDTVDEFTTRVGMQACVVVYQPANPGAEFAVFGADPLAMVIRKHKETISEEVEATLTQGMPLPEMKEQSVNLFELPPLIFDGIPTAVCKMTQAQLRAFVPLMLKYSQNRGKPGWGKEGYKPIWWPEGVPWENVRSDPRPMEERGTPWTDILRQVVVNCYAYHGRLDLLPEFNPNQLSQEVNPETAQRLQRQMAEIEQEQLEQDTLVGGVASSSTSQQVFTIDATGMEGEDDSGLATLSDASLAETAARLQQVADNTGQVQYATQMVTVTVKDAKALGQPPGTTTTVLLTAYPGGQRMPSEEEGREEFFETGGEREDDGAPDSNNVATTSVIIDPTATFNIQEDHTESSHAQSLQNVDQYLNKALVPPTVTQAEMSLVSPYISTADSAPS